MSQYTPEVVEDRISTLRENAKKLVWSSGFVALIGTLTAGGAIYSAEQHPSKTFSTVIFAVGAIASFSGTAFGLSGSSEYSNRADRLEATLVGYELAAGDPDIE